MGRPQRADQKVCSRKRPPKFQSAAEGGRQKEFDHFFSFLGALLVAFWSLFLMLLSFFSSLFSPLVCQTPFEGLTTDLFSCRFQEGIPFPNFVERSLLELPLSNLCVSRGGKRGEKVPRQGRKRGGHQRGRKGRKDA